ncbi:unnamed protein product [Pieris brassicae]|uniref:Uncharacterized protein n=1 Tax=Pieris brassicae TaxID=7116 RepID=A0A9P0XHJ8_PIEBR|nr:unnamed protein product [Pieris brassicae]
MGSRTSAQRFLHLRERAIYLDNIFGHIDELIHQPLPVDLCEYPALVVVTQGAAHGLVVHIWLVLVETPQPRYRFRVHEFKHAFLAVCPLDVPWAVFPVLKEFQKELPKISCGSLATLAFDSGRGWPVGTRPLLGLEFIVMVVPLVVPEVEDGIGEVIMREGGRRGCGEVVPPLPPPPYP